MKDHGRFVMEREAVLAFANKVLTKEDDVVWRRPAIQPSSSGC